MAAEILIEQQQEGNRWSCRVTVKEGRSQTEHVVSIDTSYRDHLVGPEISLEQLVRKSFEFLLRREPKESILGSFDLRVISRYFPEYDTEIRRALQSD